MGYYMESKHSEELVFDVENRQALTEALQELACGPEVERPEVEYADLEALEFLEREDFYCQEMPHGELSVLALNSTKSTGFIGEIFNVLSQNLSGADKKIWIIRGEDGDEWPIVFESGVIAMSPTFEVVYKINHHEGPIEKEF